MNRNEFYKQLMSEYTFDADKVRENAKRGKKRQKLTPLYVGMSAAAAAMVVTVGTIAMTNLGRNDGVSLTDTGLTTLSASDRLSHALQQLEQERESSESKDFLVTFAQPLTPAQAQSVRIEQEKWELEKSKQTQSENREDIRVVFDCEGDEEK